MKNFNIIIANKNLQNIVYLVNTINYYNMFKSYVATTNEELEKIMSHVQIDAIFRDSDFVIESNIKEIPIFDTNNIISKINEYFSKVSKYILYRDEYKEKITNQLSILGYNFKFKGTKYLLESILYIYEIDNEEAIENLEQNVYKYIAIKNNKTVTNIKTNIIKSTNYVYKFQNKEILYKYFSLNIKITPKLVISTILNKLKV